MSRHRVTEKELDDWMNAEAWYLAASSHGKGSAKLIEMSNEKVFRVTDHKEVIYLGKDKSAAVQAYNSAP